MNAKTAAGFGEWPSPISAAIATGAGTALRNLQTDAEAVYWLEVRPAEAGRGVVVRWTERDGAVDITPPVSNVATRVHEYGGGEYRAARGMVIYSEKTDGNVWLIKDGAEPRRIVAVDGCRYADFEFDPQRERVYAVREDHRGRKPTDPLNAIVALDLDPADMLANEGRPMIQSADFVASPRLSPDGRSLAWIEWDHPNMPWDATRLRLMRLDGAPGSATTLAGEPPEAIQQIAWAPDGALYFNSDRSGWSNIYRVQGDRRAIVRAEALDFGDPLWTLGTHDFAFLADGRLLCTLSELGVRRAAILTGGELQNLPIPQVRDTPQPFAGGVAYIAIPQNGPAAICVLDALRNGDVRVLRAASTLTFDQAGISTGEPMTFPTGDGELTHAFFYPPKNASFTGRDGERPPLILTSHGGPTAMATNAFSTAIQFWTTRGFAVADVNYRGSTGFGSAYRNRLRGNWGLTDVEDCIAVARGLTAAGLVDTKRIAIRGGSSSGFTTLAALAASDVFRAGASYFPVTDLSVFIDETHKFESRYIDGLIGPYPAAAEAYSARSPVRNAARITAPVAIFQGLEDRVVPPHQSELMVEALRAAGTQVEYHAFEGEGHGFLRSENLIASLECELAFYARAFGLTLPEESGA